MLRGGDPVPREGTFAQQRGDCTPEGVSCALQGESCARAWRPCILERGPVPSRRETAPGEETPCVTLKLRPDDGDPVSCRRDHVLGREETAPREWTLCPTEGTYAESRREAEPGGGNPVLR